jgi:hypothetical protein
VHAYVFTFLGQLRFHVGLHPSQEVGLDQITQHHGALVGRLDLQLRGVTVATHRYGQCELRLKNGQRLVIRVVVTKKRG